MTLKVRVPASSANLGPGFDSLGLAVSLYLIVEVLGESDKWSVEHDFGKGIPTDENNLIVHSIIELDKNITPKKLKVSSNIPLARGLGSSSAAIIAGVMLGQKLSDKTFSKDELFSVATKIEGHPDNVSPALFGGLTISWMLDQSPKTLRTDFLGLDLLAYVPGYELATSKSRSVLPTNVSHAKAVKANSLANALIASLLLKDKAKVKELIEADELHEPYRKKLVPELALLRQLGRKQNAWGTYLSGAGPTVMTLIEKEKQADFIKVAKNNGLTGQFLSLQVDVDGAVFI